MLQSELLIKFTNQQNTFNCGFVFPFAKCLTFNCKCKSFYNFITFSQIFQLDKRNKTELFLL